MAKKKTAKVAGWDKIGEMIGKKIEKESKNCDCGPWHKQMMQNHDEHNDHNDIKHSGVHYALIPSAFLDVDHLYSSAPNFIYLPVSIFL